MTTWKSPANGSWTVASNWDTGAVPGASDDVFLPSGGYTVSLNAPAQAASLTVDANVSLSIVDPGGLDAFSGDVNNAGFFGVDSDSYSSEGGSSVAVGGTLTNTGTVVIGPPTGGLSAASTLTVGGLAGNGGVALHGSGGATPSQAALLVQSAAPGALTASLTLDGDALLSYASGQIGTIASGVELSLSGTGAFVADASDPATNSALTGLTENDGTLHLVYGVQVAPGGNLLNTGALDLDGDSYSNDGGSSLTIAGTLTNTGSIVIGPATGGLSANTTLTAGALTGSGGIAINGAADLAELDVLAAAPSVLASNLVLGGNSLLEYASGQIGTIAAGKTLSLYGPLAVIDDAGVIGSNSALAGLTENDGTFQLYYGDTASLTGNLANTGFLGLDSDSYSGEGGSSLTIAGTLTNTGSIVIGPGTGGLSANTTLTVGALTGGGGIAITGGGTAALAELDVLSAAPAILANNLTMSGNALLEYASGEIGTIAGTSTLNLYGPLAVIDDSGAIGSNSALAGLAENDGTFHLYNGDTASLTGNLANAGFLGLDSDSYSGEGGSSLTIAGTLTNTGSIVIGPGTGGLSANTTLTAGALTGGGGISITGGGTADLAELDVLSAAPAVLANNLGMAGDSLLEYASGEIGTIAGTSTLNLFGPLAVIADAGSTGSNSALTGLTENDGTFHLYNGASASLTGNLANTGFLGLDSDSYSNEGSSGLTIAGTLTNTGSIVIGPGTGGLSASTTLTAGALTGGGGISITGGGTADLAELNILSTAPTILANNLGMAGNSLLEYTSGQIGTIAGTSTLNLIGPLAVIADAGSTGSNSALTGLTENDGTFHLYNGASASLTGNLANTGFLGLDSDAYSNEGGSSLTVAGTLTNTGSIVIGPGTDSLSANTTLTAGALTGGGGIEITGAGTADLAELDVLSAAPAVLANNLGMGGNSLLKYASGQIGTIAGTSTLNLYGPLAAIADASATGSNSALAGLTENDGTFRFYNGASASLTGNLSNAGFLGLDSDAYSNEGGSSLTIAGTLTNTGSIVIGPDTSSLSASTTMTVGALTGGGGIEITGAGTAELAELNVLSAAPTIFAANLTMSSNSLLEYASGQIGTIASGKTLNLYGPLAAIADAGTAGPNSALNSLAENDGTMRLYNGATVTTFGNLSNTGALVLDADPFSTEGGSSFNVAETLTNTGSIAIGPDTGGLSANTTLTAGDLVNDGAIALQGASSTPQAIVSVQGTVTNAGTLNIGSNAEVLLAAGGIFTQQAGETSIEGTLTAGTVDIAGGTLLNEGVLTAGTVSFTGFGGTFAFGTNAPVIAGFIAGDTLDLLGMTATQVQATYSAATGDSTLAVTLSGGGVEDYTLTGDYAAAGFAIAHAGGNSTIETGVTGGGAAPAFEVTAGRGDLEPGTTPNTYVLNLGQTTFGGAALVADLSVLNAALPPADLLDGSFTISPGPGYTNNGFGTFTAVGAGNLDIGPAITLDSSALGTFTETIVLNPVDQNGTGTLTPLPAMTVTVEGSVLAPPPANVPPPFPTAIVWGDAHVTTFDGLSYTFEAEGEFVLAHATAPGDSFQVQARLSPSSPGSNVTVMTMVAAEVGSDRVTFATGRTDPVWVDGSAVNLGGAGGIMQLSGGTLEEAAPGTYILTWNTGESMVVQTGVSLNVSLSLSAADGPGSVVGLLGGDSGQANDFALANGTPIPSPISTTQLYGEFANAWRVTQSTSLLDYGPGQTSGTFTNPNVPNATVALSNLPAAVVQSAEQQTAAAGITDPVIAQQAAYDVAVTGNPQFLASANFAQSVDVTSTLADIVNASAATPAIGVDAVLANETETQGGPTNVSFTVYLTAPAAQSETVDWAVTAPGAGYLDAASFGGVLPSGSVTFAQGQTVASVTVAVPETAFGTEPSDTLQMTVSATDSTAVFAPTAQTVLNNPNPEPGPPAGAAITEISGGGTLTQTGTAYVLNLGTIEQDTGTITAQIGVANTGVTGSDELSGTFATAPSGPYVLTNFSQFGPVDGQSSNTAPHLSVATTADGTFTQTITLSPEDSNNTGYSAALPDETLTVEATVANLPPPVISAPLTVISGFVGTPTQISGLSISDPNAPGQPLTVTLTSATGTMTTSAPGALAIGGAGTGTLTLSGDLTSINEALAALSYTAAAAGTGSVTMTVTDADRASASQAITFDTTPIPDTGAILEAPIDTLVAGAPSGFAGVQLIDPYDELMGNTVRLVLSSSDVDLSVKGPPGAVITGAGTGDLTITGTVQEINAVLADDLIGSISIANVLLAELLLNNVKANLTYIALNAALGLPQSAGPGISEDDLIGLAGPEGKSFAVGATFAAFELSTVAAAAVGATPPNQAEVLRDIIIILSASHIVTPDGTIYEFNPEGEFILAASSQSGDSFLVQARFQPLDNGSSASVMTQVAAQLGTDRVTFGVGRASLIWVDGAPVTLSQGNPYDLSGGQVTQMSSNTYEVVWDTGESMTLTASSNYLSVQMAPGPNNTPTSIFGLLSNSTTAGGEFVLPDGTALPQPLTQSDFNLFVQSWAVPSGYSLLDYGPSQTTATFTDTNFPETPIVLSALPADVLAAAAAAVASTGLTDPGAVAAAEFDYVASGGDMELVQTDASLLSGLSTTQAQIATPPTPVALGVLATQASVTATGSTPTAVTFMAYLTGTETTDTTVQWNVASLGAGFLTAADFGTALPSGTVTIAAGQTEVPITVTLPAGQIGSLAQENLGLEVTGPGGIPVFVGSAQTTINQPVSGAPPVPQIVDLIALGQFSGSGTSYTLDLGDIQYGEPLPPIQLGIENAATGQSDELTGTIVANPVDGFTINGAGLPSPLFAGQSYDGINVSVVYSKLGENTQTITFDPVDSNASGYKNPLPPVTLTIEDNIVTPTMVFSQAWGDVHIVTYNGLLYNFQAVGEFTLAKSVNPSDSFDIQLRLSPYQDIYGSVSIITQVGVSLGSDRITFDPTRPDTVWVDGAPSAISASAPVINFAAGSLTQMSVNTWQVLWNTGEEATITNAGIYMNVTDGIPLSEPDQVHGLQGEDAGQANDFQLSDGTVLQQPLSYAQLYGVFANSWRITQPASLLDYGSGQTTATFTNTGYPADYFNPDTLPPALLQQAQSLVAADGITDPGLAAAAVQDYLATNDTNFINSAAAVQQQLASTTPYTPTGQPAPEIAAGVEAASPGVVEPSSGAIPVVFDLSQTGTLDVDNVIDYTVIDGGTGYVGASAFGGVLPSGVATIAAGQTTSSFTISVPSGVLGSLATEDLEVGITSSGPIFAPTAVAAIVNNAAVPGTQAVPLFTDKTTPTNLSITTPGTYALNLGNFALGQVVTPEQLELINDVMAPADTLTGSFTAPIGLGFIVTGDDLPNALTPGESYSDLYVTPETNQDGVQTETMTFAPRDVNASGYSATLPTITIVMTDTVGSTAQASLNSPNMIVFPDVLTGTTESRAVSVSNTASAPAGTLNVTPVADGDVSTTGTITGLAPGATDASDISVSLDTSGAGQMGGIVTLSANSAGAGGAAEALTNSPSITVFGLVFRQAAGSITPVVDYVHVGDPGTAALTVSNTAAADGFSENLLASLAGVSGGLGIAATGPTGEIAAGSSDASSLQLGFVTTSAGTISGTATVALTSDGGTGSGSIDGLGTSVLAPQAVPVSVTVDNYANPVFEDVSGAGTFAAGTTAYSLNLGTITQGTGPFVVDLGVLNNATGPSDVLTGSLSAIGSSAFANSGLAAIGTLAAGQSDIAPEITLATDATGTFSETITLTGTGSNPGGFAAALPAETLTVTGSIAPSTGTITPPPIPPAVADILNGGSINLGAVHVGTAASETLDISNTATGTAAALDASVQSVSGAATANGSFTGLAPGAENTTSITAGIDTSTAGVQIGTVALAFVSDGGTLGSVDLPSGTIAVSGTVYREAAAALLPLNGIVHVGDPGTISLPVGNSDPADGFSENLIAMLIGTTGSLGIAAAGPTADIAAGETNTNTLALSFATTQSGTISGSATVGLTSDGTGIDGLGQTTLTAQVVPVDIVVDNYATPVLTSDGSLTSSGPDAYVLNLGTATQGAAVLSADLNLGNSATGAADWLDGNFNATGSGQFNNALSPVSDITAGTSADAGDVSLSTSQAGVFSETIMLSPTDANADGFSDALTARNITVTGTIVAPIGTTEGDVHMVTYDGLRYDFQAVGDYVLTRSTVLDDTFQIQIETAAAPSLGAVSITTEVAAQVGSDVVTFGLGQVEVDGAADTGLSGSDPVQNLAGGQLQQLSSSEFRLTWANGEALTVTDAGPYLNTSVSLPATDAPGSVQGLLGGDSGQANDFQLADGTVLRQPLSNSEMLGAFASAWRGNSLLVGVSPMQFIYTDGTSGQTVTQATAAGQILTAAPDVNVLSDTGGFGVTFLGTLSELANETITGFSAKDVIDVSGLNGATAIASYAGGLLTVSDGRQSGGISLSGQVDGGFKVTSDQHGGSLITLT